MNKTAFFTLLFLSVAVSAFAQKTANIWLDDLTIQSYSEGIRPVQAKVNYTNDSLKMKGVYYSRGLGAQTVSVLAFNLNKNAKRFTAVVGADDKANKDIAISFFVIADKKVLFESGKMKVGDAPKKVDVNLEGVKQLGLLVTDSVGGIGNKWTNCNWADAQLVMNEGTKPEHIPNNDEKYILTPPPAKTPRINSAKVFGATPHNPFLYTIAQPAIVLCNFQQTIFRQVLLLIQKQASFQGQLNNEASIQPRSKPKMPWEKQQQN